MTTREAADVLGISITSISRLIKRGLFKAEKFGPIWMIERVSFSRYAKRVKGKSTHDPTRGKRED